MGATYNLWLSDAVGNRLRPITGITSLQWTKLRNDYGEFALETSTYFINLITEARVDYRLEIERKNPDGIQRIEAIGLFRQRDISYDGSLEKVVLAGPDQNHLLTRRIIKVYPGDARTAHKTGTADDVMKEYVDEWLGPAATAADDITGIIDFSIQADASAGPNVDVRESRRVLLAGLQDVSQASREAGTPICFQVRPVTSTQWQFRTYVNQIGTDRTAGALRRVFSPELGNLVNPRYVYDRRDEITVAIGLGKGIDDNRHIIIVEDAAREVDSPLNRIMYCIDARNDRDNSLLRKAQKKLIDGEPKRTFKAVILDTPANRYGVDWDFGDRVIAAWAGEEFTVEVTGVCGVLGKDGSEKLYAKVEAVA